MLCLYAAVDYQYVTIKDASINHCVTFDSKDVGGDLVMNQKAVDIDQLFGLIS